MTDIIKLETTNLSANKDANDTAQALLSEYMELREIYQAIQPVLFELSEALYGEDDSPIPLEKLIKESIQWIKENKNA